MGSQVAQSLTHRRVRRTATHSEVRMILSDYRTCLLQKRKQQRRLPCDLPRIPNRAGLAWLTAHREGSRGTHTTSNVRAGRAARVCGRSLFAAASRPPAAALACASGSKSRLVDGLPASLTSAPFALEAAVPSAERRSNQLSDERCGSGHSLSAATSRETVWASDEFAGMNSNWTRSSRSRVMLSCMQAKCDSYFMPGGR